MDRGVDWEDYRAFFGWRGPNQAPIDEECCRTIEDLAADILGLSDGDRAGAWGVASPPGRFAQAVIGVRPVVRIGDEELRGRAERLGVVEVGVKVFKVGDDARREGLAVVPFQEARAREGGPLQASAHVQKVIAAGWRTDGRGASRAYVVQEWVGGRTLEDLRERAWSREPLDGAGARSLVEGLYRGPVVEVWSALGPTTGAVWDWRDAQLVVGGSDPPRLVLIDSDSLLELRTSRPPGQRARQERNAFGRLRAMTARLLKSQGLARGEDWIKARVARAWEAAELGRHDDRGQGRGLLCRLGQSPAGAEPDAREIDEVLTRFFGLLADASLLGPAPGLPVPRDGA